MDLVCKTPLQIAQLASAYFIGYCIGGALYWVPDRIGRKKAVTISLALSMMAETTMIFISAYNVRMVSFFIMGLFQL